MFGAFGKKYAIVIIFYVLYLVSMIALGAVFGIFDSVTFWVSVSFVTLALIAVFMGFALSSRVLIATFSLIIKKPFLTYYFVEISVAIIFLVFEIIFGVFPPLVNLVQLPIIIAFGAWLFATYRYIDNKTKEESIVKMQSIVYTTIDTTEMVKYGFCVTDAIDSLTDTIRTMSFDSNSNANKLYTEIIEAINKLNDLMRENTEEIKVISQIKEIEKLIERRRNVNREF